MATPHPTGAADLRQIHPNSEVSPARAAWRLHKARLLIELELHGHAWEVQSGLRFELRMSISQSVPLCQVVCGDEILVAGALV